MFGKMALSFTKKKTEQSAENKSTPKERPTVSFAKALAVGLIILFVIGLLLFIVEYHLTELTQKKDLLQRVDTIAETFSKSYEQTLEVTELYDSGMQAKADSVAYLLDHADSRVINTSLRNLFGVQDIVVGVRVPEQNGHGYRYYRSRTKDGTEVTLIKVSDDLDELLNNIYTQNKILNRIVSLQDMFFIVTSSTGDIVYYPDSSFIGRNISALGIGLDDLVQGDAKWLKINKDRYYTSSCSNDSLNITITCGFTTRSMTTNARIASFVLYIIVCVVMIVVVAHTYFSKQEIRRIARTGGDFMAAVKLASKKLGVFVAVGLIVIALVAYYIQTLFALTLYSVSTQDTVDQIEVNIEEGEFSAEQLKALYNRSYLNKAQIISYILSSCPDLQTKAELKKLSNIFGIEYIMMFDQNGVETLSDSGIKGFVISDDPSQQSYAFNVLKYGVPYYVQEAMPEELTGKYHQFIGVAMYDEEGESDGFLQIAASTDKLETLLNEVSLETILRTAIAGTVEDILAADKDTGKLIYTSIGRYKDGTVFDLGIQEDEFRNHYFGNIRVGSSNYYATSFETGSNLIFLAENKASLFYGRIGITIFSIALCTIGIVIFMVYMHNRQVIEPPEHNDDMYVEVNTAGGRNKRTLNILYRIMRDGGDWTVKTPEEKTSTIVQAVVIIFAVIILLSIPFKNILYTEDTIFGFTLSNRWQKGLNVFALTEVIALSFIYFAFINLFNYLIKEAVKIATPKNETLLRLASSFVHYIGTIAFLYYDLSLFGFDTKSLLASAGLLTLVVGLGAQNLITDILAGIFIIFEKEFQVGDIIEVNGYRGTVLEIGIRSTRIVNTYQDVKSISNRDLSNVVNKTRRNSYMDMMLDVKFNADIEKIESVLKAELPKIKDMSEYIISGPSYDGIDRIENGIMKLNIRTECVEEHRFEVRTLLNKEIKRIFDQYGLTL